jgi:putative spermidine/putrescine transport system ATP-binding protein
VTTRGVALALDDITHRFGHTVAVDGVSLRVEPGEIVALLGPSGCGKTTLLRIVAGLLRQSGGHVAVDGGIVDDLPPNERGAGIVFQNYALFPHMTVERNVGYGLRARGEPRPEIATTVARMLALVRMDGFARRLPRQLSGGQQQRVALARTLAVSPRVLLLDEPFGALDEITRQRMNLELLRIWQETRTTAILVTHTISEAVFMADKVHVLAASPGRLVKTIDIDLPRPRRLALMRTPLFNRLENEIRDALFGEEMAERSSLETVKVAARG